MLEVENPPTETLTRHELQLMLDSAAEKGAEKAMERLGLHDEHAPQDIAELRTLLDAWRSTKKTVWTTVVRTITVVVLTILGSYVYFKHGIGE